MPGHMLICVQLAFRFSSGFQLHRQRVRAASEMDSESIGPCLQRFERRILLLCALRRNGGALYSSVVGRQSSKLEVLGSIPSGVFFRKDCFTIKIVGMHALALLRKKVWPGGLRRRLKAPFH